MSLKRATRSRARVCACVCVCVCVYATYLVELQQAAIVDAEVRLDALGLGAVGGVARVRFRDAGQHDALQLLTPEEPGEEGTVWTQDSLKEVRLDFIRKE